MLYKASFFKRTLLKFKYGYKSSSESYEKFLRKKGISIGKNVKFNSPWTLIIDYLKPWLLEIGDDVIIAGNVSIITHGADWRILHNLYGDVIGSGDKVKIGNNVFIGIGTTILKGVTIGNNVIIGAGSIVTKDLESNGVYAGSPARFIMSIEDYYNKRKSMQLKEFKTNVIEYYRRYQKYPSKHLMKEYFWIFTNRDGKIDEEFQKLNDDCSNFQNAENKFLKTRPLYKSYEEFLEEVKNEYKENI